MRLPRAAIWLTAFVGAWGAPWTATATPVGVEFEDEDEEIPDFVEAPEPPPPAPAPAAAPAPAPRWRSSVGGGVAHFAADGPGRAQDSLDNSLDILSTRMYSYRCGADQTSSLFEVLGRGLSSVSVRTQVGNCIADGGR